MNKARIYKITCDDFDVDIVKLSHDQYSTQVGRDAVRRDYAQKNGIKTWGVRLTEIGRNYIVWTDMLTGKTHRKYLSD